MSYRSSIILTILLIFLGSISCRNNTEKVEDIVPKKKILIEGDPNDNTPLKDLNNQQKEIELIDSGKNKSPEIDYLKDGLDA